MNDEAVNVAFRNERKLLRSTVRKGVAFHDSLAVPTQRIAGIAIPQSSGHIRSAEQIPAVFLDHTDAAELRVLENFHLVHVLPPSGAIEKRLLTSRRTYRG